MTTAVWRCEPRSHGRRKADSPLPGRAPVLPCPIDRRLRRCVLPGTQHLFRPGVRTCVVGWLFFAPGAYLCPWLAGPCASPPSGGHGRPCARPLEATTGRSMAMAVQGERRCGVGCGGPACARVRCTSGRSASVACGVRGVRAAQQRGSRQSDSSKQKSRRNASSIMMSSRKSQKRI